MFDWVVMNVIHMLFKILVVAQDMFPKSVLPNCLLLFPDPSRGRF